MAESNRRKMGLALAEASEWERGRRRALGTDGCRRWEDGEIQSCIPDGKVSIPSNVGCVAKFATEIERPVFVDDINTWRRELGKETYKVVALGECITRNCVQFFQFH